MRAGKAYLSSLGTTGVLIASSLLLLAVVGALVAFDSWPGSATAEPQTVAISAQGAAGPERAGAVLAAAAPGPIERAAAQASFVPARRAVRAVGRSESGAATARAPTPLPGVSMVPAAAPPQQSGAAPADSAAAPAAPAGPGPAPTLDEGAELPALPHLGGAPVAGGAPQGGDRLTEVTGGAGGATGHLNPLRGATVRADR